MNALLTDMPMFLPPLCRMYATAAARGDGLLLLCGGRDISGTPLGDAYGFARHRDGRWEWHAGVASAFRSNAHMPAC